MGVGPVRHFGWSCAVLLGVLAIAALVAATPGQSQPSHTRSAADLGPLRGTDAGVRYGRDVDGRGDAPPDSDIREDLERTRREMTGGTPPPPPGPTEHRHLRPLDPGRSAN